VFALLASAVDGGGGMERGRAVPTTSVLWSWEMLVMARMTEAPTYDTNSPFWRNTRKSTIIDVARMSRSPVKQI